MKKGWQSALLTAIVLLCLCPLRAQAAGTVTVSGVSGVKGETVAVTVSLTSDDVCSGGMVVVYDGDMLELVGTQATDRFNCLANGEEEGLVRVSFMRVQPIEEERLCTLNFRIMGDIADGGSVVTAQNVVLRNFDAELVDADVVQGAVERRAVSLRITGAETAEYQTARAVIELGGNQMPAGGNFAVHYDPACFEFASVLPLKAMAGAWYDSFVTEPGVVRIAFGSTEELTAGPLCALVFQAVGSEGSASRLEVRSALMYDADSDSLDVTVTEDSLNILAPSGRDPKLWLVGGALQEDGSAKAAVVLQGRGNVCGGNFTLTYDSAMTAQVEAVDGCQVSVENGAIRVSWASLMPAAGDLELLTVTFTEAVESDLTFEDVILYHQEGQQIDRVDVRAGRISRREAVNAWSEVTTGSGQYTVAVDLADARFFAARPTAAVTLIAAAYDQGRMVGLQTASVTDLGSGVAEGSLTVKAGAGVSEIRVFLMSDLSSPDILAQEIRIPAGSFVSQ